MEVSNNKARLVADVDQYISSWWLTSSFLIMAIVIAGLVGCCVSRLDSDHGAR